MPVTLSEREPKSGLSFAVTLCGLQAQMSKHEPLPLCPNGADGTWDLSNIRSGRVCTL